MDKITLYIDFKNIMTSEYMVDMLKIPKAINDHIVTTGLSTNINRKYVFMSTPSNEHQNNFANLLVQNKFDVICLDYMDKAIDVAIASQLISDAHKNIFDIGVIMSGNISLYPAIREARNIGKQILIANFSDKISTIYKNNNYETGPFDLDILYLDSILETIADKAIKSDIVADKILDEVESDFFDGNIDFNKIDIKMYIIYWSLRVRYLQAHQDLLRTDNQNLIKKVFDKLNGLSDEYRPGYIKSLNKKWSPESWEEEIKLISRSW